MAPSSTVRVLSAPAQLHDGDEIRLGRAVVVLRFTSALAATGTESGGAPKDPVPG